MKNALKTFTLIFLFAFGQAFAANKEIASIGKVKITEEEAKTYTKLNGLGEFNELQVEVKKAILTRLANDKMLEMEAKKEGMDKTDETVFTVRSILVSKYIQKHSGSFEEEALREYENSATELKGKNTYTISHILVKDEAEAKVLKGEIIGANKFWKEKFKEVAKVRSLDQASAKNNGFVGEVPETNLPADLLTSLKKMKTNLLYGPVQTNLGFHLIVLEGVKPIQIPPFATVKPSFMAKVYNEKMNELAGKLAGKNSIKFNLD